ncbi:MAG: GatB/YqeY domain-containing protein [Candidatus Paceibacterota bacterium]|jgi:hypothetical protein
MIRETLVARLPEALKQHDEFTALIVRGALSALQNKEIELRGAGKDMAEQDAIEVVRKEVKKRKDAAVLFQSGNRPELADKELREAAFLEALLPAQLGEDEVRVLVNEVVAAHGPMTQKDMGIVIKEVGVRAKGMADGGLVARLVKEKISG